MSPLLSFRLSSEHKDEKIYDPGMGWAGFVFGQQGENVAATKGAFSYFFTVILGKAYKS
jgi:hypothetical protein